MEPPSLQAEADQALERALQNDKRHQARYRLCRRRPESGPAQRTRTASDCPWIRFSAARKWKFLQPADPAPGAAAQTRRPR